jgi:microsomal dipeptidase-like Zn-dependent dipeptidase
LIRDVVAVAGTGGIIGIGFWPKATCGDDPEAIARAIRYAANTVGVAHVSPGLGL